MFGLENWKVAVCLQKLDSNKMFGLKSDQNHLHVSPLSFKMDVSVEVSIRGGRGSEVVLQIYQPCLTPSWRSSDERPVSK